MPTMPTSDSYQARLMDLYAPLSLLFYSFLYLPQTILANPLLLFQPSHLQSSWFGNLWKFLGPQMALSPEQIPYISRLFSRARGVVLELGPGNGDQMRHLTTMVQSGTVTKVVGAEPTVSLHENLLRNAKGVGLDPEKEKYIVIPAGAEPSSLIPALHDAGLYGGGEGVFDTVICIKSMCCVQQGQLVGIVRNIQGLLKPGGEFLFFEHVANDEDFFTMAWAWTLGWIWPLVMASMK